MTICNSTGRGPNYRDLTGQVFGKLTVIAEHHTDIRKNVHWLVRCECGKTTVVPSHNLKTGGTTSCGCFKRTHLLGNTLRKTHGGRKTVEYQAWRRMKKYCYCPNAAYWADYGGRGITVCAGWRNSFESFLADMGTRPAAADSLDRVDNERGYDCGKCEDCKARGATANCRWATITQQMRNKRTTVLLTHQGETLSLPEWAERVGISQNVIRMRLRLGWSVDTALTTPTRGWKRQR